MSASTNRPLARALILGLVTFSAFVALADAASEHNGVTRLDPRITAQVVHERNAMLTAVARGLTFIGSEIVVGSVVVLVMGLLVWRRQIRSLAMVAFGMGGSVVMTLSLKAAVERARPPAYDRLGPFDPSYSFPSGHTLNSAVALGLIVLTLVPSLHSRPLRTFATSAAIMLALGIGASRVYLGYHWATDVIAAWLLATFWLTALQLVRAALFAQSGASQVHELSVTP